MPDETRINKNSVAENVSDLKEAQHSSPEQQRQPVIAHDRRSRLRRSEEAACPEDADGCGPRYRRRIVGQETLFKKEESGIATSCFAR